VKKIKQWFLWSKNKSFLSPMIQLILHPKFFKYYYHEMSQNSLAKKVNAHGITTMVQFQAKTRILQFAISSGVHSAVCPLDTEGFPHRHKWLEHEDDL
jgi:hypothetical protein